MSQTCQPTELLDEPLADRTQNSVRAAVEFLRGTQRQEGQWMGATRSNHLMLYAAGLALIGTGPDSPVIEDICDYIESCCQPSGGLAPFPGEPASSFDTSLALPVIKWARPHSRTVASAEKYLSKRMVRFADPRVLFMQWVFEPAKRESISRDKGPPSWLRMLALRLSRQHPSERWNLRRMYRRCYPGHSVLFDDILKPVLCRAYTFPPIGRLDEAARVCAMPLGFDMMVIMYAALRRLAGDESAEAFTLYDFAFDRLRAGTFPDGSYHFIGVNVAHLLMAQAFGLEDQFESAKRAFEKITYAKDGWILTESLSMPVWETALTVLALTKAGLQANEPIVSRAVEYLKEAQCLEHGLWNWEYAPGMVRERAVADTDTTGTTMMALTACGVSPDSPLMQRAKASLLKMQEDRGAFSLYHGMLRPNWCWLSNSSRSAQALIGAGLSPDSEPVERFANWLLSMQNNDGSWLDGWCARYIHGTVVATEALIGCAVFHPGDVHTSRVAQWLLAEQNQDGGWGENWYGGRTNSTAEHTGLALYGLSLCGADGGVARDAVRAGVRWLCENQRPDGSWDAAYFMNYGFDFGAADTQFPIVWALHGLGSVSQLKL